MFYSETLLSKTGPLARVWLSANVERKLTKSHILQSDIGDSVSAIVDRGSAPLALRLSGQLLLGVVRIYSRKARYLLDDCNEAILKIKMAFRPGNVDLPANQSNAMSSAALNLPEKLNDIDLLGPGPDPSYLLSQLPDEDPSLLDFGNSQLLRHSVDRGRASSVASGLLDEDGFDPLSSRRDSGIEIGRRAEGHSMLDADTTMAGNDELLDNDGIDFGNLEEPEPIADEDLGMPADADGTHMDVDGLDNVPDLEPDVDPISEPVNAGHTRQSASPLSSIRSSVERALDGTFHHELEQGVYDQEEPSVHQAQRAKKRKVLQPDTETEIHSNQIREQQNDRSKILKPACFLPQDPVLLALMEMQRTGGFVSSILGDEQSKGWAPQLRGVLSLEVVRRSSGQKRKRDDGRSGLQGSQTPATGLHSQEVNLPADETVAGLEAPGSNDLIDIPADDEVPIQPIEDHFEPEQGAYDHDAAGTGDNFDVTMAPLLHPSESGPVSLGTKNAVHLLRDRFGQDAETSPTKRQKSSVLFSELMPERTRTRADATKMFFEVLVLATKDAVKVEQAQVKVGGPLRVRAKRGLWGSWAETEAGGEIAEQTQQGAAVAS